MALKNQVPNVYSVGLQNVGSYLVSGKPFLARRSVSAGDQIKIEFPTVAKNVTIRIPNPPNSALGYLDNVGATDRMYTNGSLTPYGDTASDFTFSNWLKGPSYTGNEMPIRLTSTDTTGYFTYQFRSNNEIRFVSVNNAAADTFNSGNKTLSDPNGWHHYVITQVTGNVHIYIDNVHVDSTAKGNLVPMNDFNIPPNLGSAALTKAVHDEITFWTSGMDATQVGELYNSGEYIDPKSHSLESSLEGWWTMGDFPGDRLDGALTRINDAALPEQDVTLFSTSDAFKSFVAGPFTAAQTVGKLRVHLASTGSSGGPPGSYVIGNKHYREIQGYGTTITLPMKTKEIYLTGVGAQVTFEVIAELTNIPDERMYALTGSGIDE